MTVTALLVSHDGARWLPAVLAGLADQQRRPERVLAVDTGGNDGSADLIREALGPDSVISHPGSFPDAVRHALRSIDSEWVWLVHDDANPDPGALAALLEAAEESGADILGPKLREWPSLRRLLEAGLTISATGRRETGLELGEYDQGQHDTIREVLAVNTAGMLVRREVLEELGGFDSQLPLFGNDIDFGWRAARAGYKTVIVPGAIVFHAEAAHRGLRRTRLLGRRLRTHRAEREAALFTLLANVSSRGLVWQAIRLVFGTGLRFLGYLLARSPGHAGDEVAALFNVFTRPGRIISARRSRRAIHGGSPEDVRRLLAPWWLPYRHGLDFVSDLATAAANQGRDAAARRRYARAEDAGIPIDEDEEDLSPDSGLLARFLTSPVALGLTAFALLCLWGAREAFGSITGGALSPAPETDNHWWTLLVEGWHEIGPGTDAPAPGYLLPLASLASLLNGSPTAAVSVMFVLAVPLAAWGAWRFLLVAAELGAAQEHTRVLVGWGALAYAAVPVASGAWGQGRFGIVVAATLLPWLAHAAIALGDPSAERRWRAAWRTGLLLTLITAFAPTAWLVVVLVIAALLATIARMAPDMVRDRAVWGPLAVPIAVPPLLLLPAAVGVLGHDVSTILLEAGRLSPTPSGLELLAGRLGDPSAPLWAGLLLVPPALIALARNRTRIVVTACWLVVALAALLATLLSHVTVELPAGEARPGLGFLLVIIQGALVTAIVTAGHGVVAELRSESLNWRQPLAGVVALCAVLVPVVGLGWWFAIGDDLLTEPGDNDVPAYMAQAAELGPEHGVLLLRGNVDDGLTWSVYRDDGITLGEEEILALTMPDEKLDEKVAELVSRPTPEVVEAIAGEGVQYIVMPDPVEAQVAATLDAVAGLTQASGSERTTRAWQIDEPPTRGVVSGDGPWWHLPFFVLQVIAFLAVLVLCGPARPTFDEPEEDES